MKSSDLELLNVLVPKANLKELIFSYCVAFTTQGGDCIIPWQNTDYASLLRFIITSLVINKNISLKNILWSSLLIEVALACYQHIQGKQKPRFFVLSQSAFLWDKLNFDNAKYQHSKTWWKGVKAGCFAGISLKLDKLRTLKINFDQYLIHDLHELAHNSITWRNISVRLSVPHIVKKLKYKLSTPICLVFFRWTRCKECFSLSSLFTYKLFKNIIRDAHNL